MKKENRGGAPTHTQDKIRYILDSLAEGQIITPSVARDMANPEWENAETRVLIVRLSPWRDVDISTSHLVLFDEIRASLPDAFIDFAFLPPAADRKRLAPLGLSWFFGRCSRKSPAEFDIVMISNAFALELINLPYLFSTSGIPMSAAERMKIDDVPILIIGGSNASALGAIVRNHDDGGSPASDAFVDGIFFGEGEGSIGRLARILAGRGENGPAAASARPAASRGTRCGAHPRMERLRAAAAITGFWPCLLTKGAKRAIAAGRPHTLTKPLVLNGPNASSARLSITSGCPGYCSFCLEGWDRRPYAEADLDGLLDRARLLRAESGASNLEIYSFNFNTHSRVFDLIFELNRIFKKVSFMSQRLDILAETKGLIEAETAGGKRSFTLGIEGVSGKMRAYYRKGLSRGHLRSCLDMTIARGVKEVKLFFIIAGIEDSGDIEEFSALMQEIHEKKKQSAPSIRILVSAGYLVRLPFTPLQYAPVESDGSRLEAIRRQLQAECRKHDIEFRTASDIDEYHVDQILSLAGSAIFPWLAKIPESGFVYDAALGKGTWSSLKAHIRDCGLLESGFYSEKSAEYRPPLAFIEDESHFSTLFKHYSEARQFLDRPLCLGKKCTLCDACGDPDERKMMVGHAIAPMRDASHAEKIGRLVAIKADFSPAYAVVEMPSELSRAESAYRSSWLLRGLSRNVAGAEKIVFDAREMLFAENSPFGGLIDNSQGRYGSSVFALYGPDRRKIGMLLKLLGENNPAQNGNPAFDFRISEMKELPSPKHVVLEIEFPAGHEEETKRAFEYFLSHTSQPYTARNSGHEMDYVFPPASAGRKLLAAAHLDCRGPIGLLGLKAGEKSALSPLLAALGDACGTSLSARVRGWEQDKPRE